MSKKRKPNPHAVSNAVSVTVYDMSGAPIPTIVANEIADSVNEIVKRESLVANYTRT